MFSLLYYLNHGLSDLYIQSQRQFEILKFLIGYFSISLNQRTRKKCSNHIKHPPTNAGTEQSVDFSAFIQLISGGCRSNSSILCPIKHQFPNELKLLILRLQAIVFLYYFLKSAFYIFSILKEISINLLCFHSSSHNYMKYHVPPTVDV